MSTRLVAFLGILLGLCFNLSLGSVVQAKSEPLAWPGRARGVGASEERSPHGPPQKDASPGQSVPLQGNIHIQSPGSPHTPYNSDPPTSGPHVPFIVRWGIHNVPIPREIQVHNLEDGGVIIQYNCDNCAEMVSKLEAIVQQYQKKAEAERSKTESKHPSRYEHLILAPYSGMDSAIALTAWGRIDKFNEFDAERITKFIEAYIGIDHHPANE